MRILELAQRGLGGSAFALLVAAFVVSVLALTVVIRWRSSRPRFPGMATIDALSRVGGPGGSSASDEGVRIIPAGQRDDADARADARADIEA